VQSKKVVLKLELFINFKQSMMRGMSIEEMMEHIQERVEHIQVAEYNSADELENYLATDIRSSQLSEQKKRIKRGMKKVRDRKLGKRALDEGSSSEQSAKEFEKYYNIPKLTTLRRQKEKIKQALKKLRGRMNGSKALGEGDDEASSDQSEEDHLFV